MSYIYRYVRAVFCPVFGRQPEAHCLQNSELFSNPWVFFGKYLKFFLRIQMSCFDNHVTSGVRFWTTVRPRQPEGTEYRALHLRSTEKTFKTKRNVAPARIKIYVLRIMLSCRLKRTLAVIVATRRSLVRLSLHPNTVHQRHLQTELETIMQKSRRNLRDYCCNSCCTTKTPQILPAIIAILLMINRLNLEKLYSP